MIRSEIAAWFGSFDRFAGGQGGADRGFWLEAWDGKSHTVDRVKFKHALQIPYLSVAMAGAIQPDRLAKIFNDADDGLIARFLYIFPEPLEPQRCDPGAQSTVGELIEAFGKLHRLRWTQDGDGHSVPLQMRLEEAAGDILHTLKQETSALERKGRGGGLVGHWRGKNAGRLLRIGLTLEFLAWAKEGEVNAEPVSISGEMIGRAAAYLKYCGAMLERSLGALLQSPAQREAAILAQMIIDDRMTGVNERAVYQSSGFTKLRNSTFRQEVFSELEKAGWVRRAFKSAPGRPPGHWDVNPRIR
jgi:hypothetical protein